MDLTKSLLEGFATFLGGAAATVLFLMPGYVLSKAFAGGVRGLTPSDRAFLATTASGGLLTHLLVIWWTVPLFRSVFETFPQIDARHYLEVLAWAALVLAVLPAAIGATAARIADTRTGPIYNVLSYLGFTTAKRTAEAWTWAFRQMTRSPDEVWLRVRLKNKGGTYYGRFGPNALGSSDATVRDVYLERTWPVDSKGQPKSADENVPNRGVWIAGDQIMTIEFFSKKRMETTNE